MRERKANGKFPPKPRWANINCSSRTTAEGRSTLFPPLLRFGTWVGGDMDGNPDVHAQTIRETLARHQQLIVNNYFLECQQLQEALSQSATRVAISPELQARIDHYMTLLSAALAALADQGYDADFGARPLRRVIQQKVEDPLSDRVLGGEFQHGDNVLVSLNSEGEIVLERDGEKQIEEAPAAPAV